MDDAFKAFDCAIAPVTALAFPPAPDPAIAGDTLFHGAGDHAGFELST